MENILQLLKMLHLPQQFHSLVYTHERWNKNLYIEIHSSIIQNDQKK